MADYWSSQISNYGPEFFFFFWGLSILFLSLVINLFVIIIFCGYIEVGSLGFQ
jgi:hypothetical protein